MRHKLAWAIVALVAALVGGCSDDDGTDPTPPAGEPGARFDLDADLTDPASFYALPFPSDLRLTAEGTPDLTGMPRATTPAADSLVPAAMDRPGFSAISVAFFHFNNAIPEQDEYQVIPADASSPVLLLDVDPDSPDRGTLYPTLAYTPAPDDYVPENFLAVAPYPGIVMREGRSYAYVIQRSFNDASGQPLPVPAALAALAAGETPAGAMAADAAALYAPLWETLDQISVPRTEVAAATVFTIGGVVAQTYELSQKVVDQYDVEITGLGLDPDDGAAHPRFCELHGSMTLPIFQIGEPPYDTQGQIEIGPDGAPVHQRDITVQVAITIPKQEMPAGGYPLVLYIHGSGGLFDQVVDRGTITTEGGEPTKGEGPAHVLAEHGLAAAGTALPLNPERVPGATDYAYINMTNPGSFGYTFRQGVFEQRLFLEALVDLTIDPATLTGCDGPALPNGETSYHFDASRFYAQGQSMGAQYVNLLAPVEPLVQAVVPTGAGTYWSLMLMETLLFNSTTKGIAAATVGTSTENASHLHPGIFLLQMAWDPGETMVYIPYIAKHPLADHPTRSIYEPVAPMDLYWPERVFNAVAMAYGNQQAGEMLWSSMQDALAILGLDGIQTYPVQDNVTSEAGTPYTGVVVQYEGDGLADPHSIYGQLDEVKYQYGCFLATHARTGTAVVPAPAALGTPCPE